ncbi:hypothetical protein ACVCAH_07950 [Micromonospora sp. LZ34]
MGSAHPVSRPLPGGGGRLPGKNRITAKVIEPIHQAATAIALPSY